MTCFELAETEQVVHIQKLKPLDVDSAVAAEDILEQCGNVDGDVAADEGAHAITIIPYNSAKLKKFN